MEKFRKSEDLLYWRFFLLLYLAGFAAGIVFANLAWPYRSHDLDALTAFQMRGEVEVRGTGYLWYLARKRCGLLLPAHVLGLTVLGSYAVMAGLLWTGFLGGILSAIAVLQLGIGGLLLLALSLVPQILIYVPAGLFYLTKVARMSEKSRADGRMGGRSYREYLLSCTAGLALIFCGVLVECYVNPWILNRVLGG